MINNNYLMPRHYEQLSYLEEGLCQGFVRNDACGHLKSLLSMIIHSCTFESPLHRKESNKNLVSDEMTNPILSQRKQ